ncbi:hypothetical protein [Lentzea tibetensis]|nr:hypothetical protein [Lentzea tibetensis]
MKAGDPLGGDARGSVSKARLWLVVGACALFFFGLSTARDHGSGDRFTVLVLGVGAVSLALVFAGPVVTKLVGVVFVRRWRGPATLLAGRRLAGDPVAAFRGSAGLVVAVFTGSMALTMLPGLADQVPYSDDTWRAEAIVATGIGDPRQAETLQTQTETGQAVPITEGELGGYAALVARCADLAPLLNGLTCQPGPAIYHPTGMSQVTGDFQPHTGDRSAPRPDAPARTYPARGRNYIVIDPELLPPQRPTAAAALTNEANREQVHTAVVRALPGAHLQGKERDFWADTLMEDLNRATVIGLGIAALVGGAAAAVAAAGSVIDRRQTFAALIAAGTPVKTLGRALRREVVLPVLAATAGACAAGLVVGLGLVEITREITERGGFVLTPWFLVPVAVGLVVALVAASACGPVLRGIRPGDYASE